MVPTRELATQIDDEFRGFSRMHAIARVSASAALHHRQQLALSRRANFLIGTPGRLRRS